MRAETLRREASLGGTRAAKFLLRRQAYRSPTLVDLGAAGDVLADYVIQ
jgi:hypothetical protein